MAGCASASSEMSTTSEFVSLSVGAGDAGATSARPATASPSQSRRRALQSRTPPRIGRGGNRVAVGSLETAPLTQPLRSAHTTPLPCQSKTWRRRRRRKWRRPERSLYLRRPCLLPWWPAARRCSAVIGPLRAVCPVPRFAGCLTGHFLLAVAGGRPTVALFSQGLHHFNRRNESTRSKRQSFFNCP